MNTLAPTTLTTRSNPIQNAFRATLLVGLGTLGLGGADLTAQLGGALQGIGPETSTTVNTDESSREIDPELEAAMRKGSSAFYDREFGTARLHLARARAADDPITHLYQGLMHLHGLGGPKHHEAARQHFRRSSDQGCVLAMRSMAELYHLQDDTKQESHWLRQAAIHGDEFAQWMLATRLIETENKLDGAAFAKIAVRNGFEANDEMLTSLLDHGGRAARDGLEERTAEIEAEIEQATSRNLVFLRAPIDETIRRGEPRDADQGVDAYMNEDYETARDLLVSLCAKGDTAACFHVARMHEVGLGEAKDAEKAVANYALAVLRDDPWSMNNLGSILLYGQGVVANPAMALPLFERAGLLGNSSAMLNAGYCHGTGQGTQQDYVTACAWYRLAAERGNETAQNNLDAVLPHLDAEQKAEVERLAGTLRQRVETAFVAVDLPATPIADVTDGVVTFVDDTRIGTDSTSR